MTTNPEDSTLTARLIDLAADMTKELDDEAKLLCHLNNRDLSTEDASTWMFMLGEHSGRQNALAALSAFIITQTEDLKGELEPHLAEQYDTDS
jgi:hypothetical protein